MHVPPTFLIGVNGMFGTLLRHCIVFKSGLLQHNLQHIVFSMDVYSGLAEYQMDSLRNCYLKCKLVLEEDIL